MHSTVRTRLRLAITPTRPTTNTQATTAYGRKLIECSVSARRPDQRLIQELGPEKQEGAGDLQAHGDAVERHHPAGEQVARGAQRERVLEIRANEDQSAEADQRIAR